MSLGYGYKPEIFFEQAFPEVWIKLSLHEFGTPRRESQSVDDGLIFQKAKHAWSWVARLRHRRDRSDLDVAKPQRVESAYGHTILIVACSEPNRILES